MIIIQHEKYLWQESLGCYRCIFVRGPTQMWQAMREYAPEEVKGWDPRMDRKSLGKFVAQGEEGA